MSIELDPKEVLQCLNDLGYYNINSKQLKEFLKDLKKLIKHDIKKLTVENQENTCPNSNQYYNLPHKTYNSHSINNNNNKYEDDTEELQLKTQEINVSEVFDHLYSTSTISSRAKSVPKRNSVISIDIRKPKRHSEPIIPVNATSEKTGNATSTSNKISSYTTIDSKSDDNKLSTNNIDSKSNVTNVDSKSNATNVETKSSKECCCVRTEISSKKVNALKPKVSFIKPRKPIKTCKSDPVSLYQQYQKEWKKQKVPGEDKRCDLRWAIRERMLGEPVIPVHSLDKLKKSSRF